MIDETVGLDRLRRRMSDSGSLMLGVSDGAKAAVLAALARDAKLPMLVIVPKPQHDDALADELKAWLGDDIGQRVLLFPERGALPYERLAADPGDIAARLRALDALAAAPLPPPDLTTRPPSVKGERGYGTFAGDCGVCRRSRAAYGVAG